jgi:hypothetical protein
VERRDLAGRLRDPGEATLRFSDQLERRRDTRAGLVVIIDSASASSYHHPCSAHVTEKHFETKRANDWRNGGYF